MALYPALLPPMLHWSIRVYLLALFLCFAASVDAQGNCTTGLTTPLSLVSFDGKAVLTHDGISAVYSAASNGNPISQTLGANLTLIAITERQRFAPEYSCSVPRFPESWTYTDSNIDSILQAFQLEDMNCYVYAQDKVIEGQIVRGLYVRTTLPSFPDLDWLSSYEFAEREIQTYPSLNDTFTYGVNYSYHWLPRSLKITFTASNFPWTPQNITTNSSLGNVTSSYVALHFNLALLAPVDAQLNYSDSSRSASVMLASNVQELDLNYEKCWLVDDVPYCGNQQSSVSINYSLPGLSVPVNFPMNIPLCTGQVGSSTFGQWNAIVYDPELSTLFFGSVPSQSSPSSAAKIAAPIVVILVVAVCAAVVLAIFKKVPFITKLFLPSHQKNIFAKSTAAIQPTK